jgi:hypothetical protein
MSDKHLKFYFTKTDILFLLGKLPSHSLPHPYFHPLHKWKQSSLQTKKSKLSILILYPLYQIHSANPSAMSSKYIAKLSTFTTHHGQSHCHDLLELLTAPLLALTTSQLWSVFPALVCSPCNIQPEILNI